MHNGVNSNEDSMLMLDSAYNLARFLSRDAGAAEQIAHAAFLQARRDSAVGGSGRPQLLKIVRRCYRTWLTARRQNGKSRQTPLPKAIAGSVLRSGDDNAGFAEVGALRVTIEAMPRRLREILVLKEFEKLTYREISEVTSLRTEQVISRLARARRMLAGATTLLSSPLLPRSGGEGRRSTALS
jgi:RNA polymerase sigma-70 factor (ECF subfamily)